MTNLCDTCKFDRFTNCKATSIDFMYRIGWGGSIISCKYYEQKEG